MPGKIGCLQFDGDGLPPPLFSTKEWRRIAKVLQLSEKQSEVADLVIRGQRDKEIMTRLKLKKPTVRQHLKGISKRLGTNNRTEIAYVVFATFRRLSFDGD